MHYVKEHGPIKKNIKTKNTPHTTHLAIQLSRQIPPLMHLMAQQATYRMSLNEEMFSKNLALSQD